MAFSKKVTIAQIASEANVSVATVSRIINKNGYVRPETREKVFDAMEKLDYQPYMRNTEATPKSNSLLICFPEFRNPFYSDIIKGIQATAFSRGYQPFYYEASNSRDAISEYEDILKKNNFCGILLVHNVANPEVLDHLKLRHPIVMCSEHCNSPNISFVSIDDNYAAQTAVNYLLSIGRTKIALINSLLTNNYSKHREKGFFEAMTRAGLSVPPGWVTHITDINFEMAVSAATNMLSGNDRPNAFFCVSDVYAAAAIKAIQNCGLRVPQDISVVGFDNIDLSRMTVPAITTIKQPSYEIGQQACNILINLIETPSASTEHVLLNTELIVRDSTAALMNPNNK